MKTITATELKSILAEHKIWVETNRLQGTRANLWRADLNAANLHDANLFDANLEGANLINANLINANLWGANLWGANLTGANLTGANLNRAYLWGAKLTGANLYGANLKDANLTGANLTGANLTGANLTVADLKGADLRGANLTDAILTGTILDKNKEQGTTMILSEKETAVILKMRADKVNQAKIDARDIVIQVITLVTIELSNNRPSNADIMRTDDCDEDIGSENLETISLILDLMGLKFQALTANRRAINFSYKKLNSL